MKDTPQKDQAQGQQYGNNGNPELRDHLSDQVAFPDFFPDSKGVRQTDIAEYKAIQRTQNRNDNKNHDDLHADIAKQFRCHNLQRSVPEANCSGLTKALTPRK